MAKRPKQPDRIAVGRLRDDYADVASAATRLATEVTRQLDYLIHSKGVALGFPLQARVKTWESIAEKLQRVALNIERVTDIQDLVGVRVILLFRRDLKPIAEAIESTFQVRRKYDTQARLGADQFGYSSQHFVVDVPPAWLVIPTMAGLDKLAVEIQLRTLPQHIWAEASHVLQYKAEAGVPIPIRRAVARTAALLETVDLELERVLGERDEYRRTLDEPTPTEPLNVDLIERILDETLPKESKGDEESYGVLLRELLHVGVRTRGDLVALIRQHLDYALSTDLEHVALAKEQALQRGDEPGPRLEKGVFFIQTGLVRQMLRRAFPEEIEELWQSWERQRANSPPNHRLQRTARTRRR